MYTNVKIFNMARSTLNTPSSNGNSGQEKNNDTTGLSTEYIEDPGTAMTPFCTMWPHYQSRQYKVLFLLFMVSILVVLGISIALLIETTKMEPEVSSVPTTWPYVTKLAEINSLMSQDIYDIYIVAASFGIASSVIAVFWVLFQKLILLKVFVPLCAICIILDITVIAVRHKLLIKDKTQFDSDELKTALIRDIFDNFKDDVITGNENQSIQWNEFFMKMRCCGINPVPVGSRGDFEKSYWVRSGVASSQKIPTSCCINATISSYTAPTTCKDNVNRGTYYSEGCLSRLTLEYPVKLRYHDNTVGCTGTILFLHFMMSAMSVYFIFKGEMKFRKYKADKREKENNIPDDVNYGGKRNSDQDRTPIA